MAIVLLMTSLFDVSQTAGAATLSNDGTTITKGNDNITISTNEEGQTVYTLKGDVSNGLSIALTGGETVILDGKAYEVTGKGVDYSRNSTPALKVTGDGTLIVKDATFTGGSSHDGWLDGSPGVSVDSETVSLILQGTVIFCGGSASRNDSNTLFTSGYAGMVFHGNKLMTEEGSNVTISGSSAIDGIDFGGNGGSALEFDGKIFQIASGAAVTLTAGEGSSGSNYLGTDGKKVSYTKGLFSDKDMLKESIGEEPISITLHVSGHSTVFYMKADTELDPSCFPVTAVTEYKFDTWYTDASYSTPLNMSNPFSVTEDTDYYGKYLPLSCTVIFSTDGGSDVSSQTVNNGEKAKRPESDPTKSGFVFDDWYEDQECETLYDFGSPITDNTTIYANWNPAPVPTATPTVTPQVTSKPTPTPQVTSKPTAVPTPDTAEISATLDGGTKDGWEKGRFRVTWGEVTDADGYDIFAAECSKKMPSKSPVKTVKGKKTSAKLAKIAGKVLKKKKNYKVKIKAYKMISGKKVYLGETRTYHVAGVKNKKYTNAKKVNVSVKALTLQKGKTKKIEATITRQTKKKKLLSRHHGPKLRYTSTDANVAVVSKNGKITAMEAGTCEIYATALNGVHTRIKVTVKA